MASNADIAVIAASSRGLSCSADLKEHGPTGKTCEITVDHMLFASRLETDVLRRDCVERTRRRKAATLQDATIVVSSHTAADRPSRPPAQHA